MEPVNLPILPTGEDNTYIALLPGLDRSELKKCEYELNEHDNLLEIRCLYGGLDSEGNIDGVTYPIKVDDHRMDELKNIQKLYPMNPLEVDLDEYFEEENIDEMLRFFKQLEVKYGRKHDEGDGES